MSLMSSTSDRSKQKYAHRCSTTTPARTGGRTRPEEAAMQPAMNAMEIDKPSKNPRMPI